jgi:hypothetical protein
MLRLTSPKYQSTHLFFLETFEEKMMRVIQETK